MIDIEIKFYFELQITNRKSRTYRNMKFTLKIFQNAQMILNTLYTFANINCNICSIKFAICSRRNYCLFSIFGIMCGTITGLARPHVLFISASQSERLYLIAAPNNLRADIMISPDCEVFLTVYVQLTFTF